MSKQKGSITLLVLGMIGLALVSLSGLVYLDDKIKQKEESFGAFRPSSYKGKLMTRLAEGGAESTFNTSPGEALDGTTLTTAKFGDFIVLTINPGGANEEKISVSAVSTTASTTATWTIINRGLSYTSNVSVSGNIEQHSIGEVVIISNDDHYLNQQYVSTDDAQQISGNKYFLGSVGFSNAATSSDECSASNEYCTKNYMDTIAITGSATTTETVTGGNVRLATASQAAAGTASSTTGAPLILHARLSGDTYHSASSSMLVMTGATGVLDSNFIATSSKYTWTGLNTFTAPLNASSTLSIGGSVNIGTTTPAANMGLAINGNVLISGTTTVANLVIASSTPFRIKTQYFTATSTWTRPSGVTQVEVEVYGAGGGGGGTANAGCAGGGGAGGYSYAIVAVSGNVTVNVATGGSGGSASVDGQGATATSFGSVTSNGGAGGTSQNGACSAQSGGSGGSASGGDLNVTGQNGENSHASPSFSGKGGNSPKGFGGRGKDADETNGEAASGYGAGGSGASAGNGTGGSGTGGLVIVRWVEVFGY